MDRPTNVLVTDFDGTLTQNDFYELVVEQLLPAGTPDYWAEFCARRITHFEALRSYFASIRADEAAVMDVVGQMKLDPQLPEILGMLRQAGWRVVVASAGCRWYIDQLLAACGVELEVHANPGRFVPGDGLLMELPVDSPFYSRTHGINKAGVVRHYQAAGSRVAFAGDGYPDAAPARLVHPSLRFARRNLAEVLASEELPFRPFAVWSEVAHALMTE
jgi:2,3-diketo-5-methylthio-1-phosphopentane phosphatase